MRRTGAQNPSIRIRLAAEQICEGGFCGLDSLGLTPAAPLGFDRQFTWQVIAFAGDARLGSARGQFSVQRPAQPTSMPTMTPYYTPEGQPPAGLEVSGLSAPLNTLPTVQVTANNPNAIRTAVAQANRPVNRDKHYIIILEANKTYSIQGSSVDATYPSGAAAFPPVRGNITIRGQNAVLARSTGTAVPPFRIFTVEETGYLRLENVTIRGGRATKIGGGGVHSNQGVLEVWRSTITDNRANFSETNFQVLGGGIYSYFGGLTVIESVITDNRALTTNSDGGGIGIIGYKSGATLAIQGSDIRNNRANRRGNGIYIQETDPLMNGNCFVGNYHPNPTTQTTNRSVEERNSWLHVVNSWWGSNSGPRINQAAAINNDSIHGAATYIPFRTAQPVRCDRLPTATPTHTPSPTPTPTRTPTPTLPLPYKINIISDGSRQWSTFEQGAIDVGVSNVGRAFDYMATTVSSSTSAFNLAMLENSGTEILFIRTQQQGAATVTINNYQYLYGSRAGQIASFSYPGITQGYCRTFQEGLVNQVIRPASVICNGDLIDQYSGTTRTLQASQFTIVHELGHIFDYRTFNGLSNPIAINYSLEDCNGNLIMGLFPSWTRGRRGWGTGPAQYINSVGNPAPLVTDFQQNTENSPIEAAADSFLNWVYRKNASGGVDAVDTCASRPAWDHWNGMGYRNVEWSATPHPSFIADSGGIPGIPDSSLPGDRRHFDFDTRIRQIFSTRGW